MNDTTKTIDLFPACKSIPDVLEVLMRLKRENIELGSEMGLVNADRIVAEMLAPAVVARMKYSEAGEHELKHYIDKLPLEIKTTVEIIFEHSTHFIYGEAVMRHWLSQIPGAPEINFPKNSSSEDLRNARTPADLIAALAAKFDLRATDSTSLLTRVTGEPLDTTDFTDLVAGIGKVWKVLRGHPELVEPVLLGRGIKDISNLKIRAARAQYESFSNIGDLRPEVIPGDPNTDLQFLVRKIGNRLTDATITPITPTYLLDFEQQHFDHEARAELRGEQTSEIGRMRK